MSAFFIGMAAGQLIYGPLSDRVGRRPPLLFGTLLYTAASIGCALAPSLDWLVAGRVCQALGACAGVTIARAVVADRYPPTEAARLFSLLFLVLGVAPLLAPSVGAVLLSAFGWRMIFFVLAGFGLLLFWPCAHAAREPHGARRADRRRRKRAPELSRGAAQPAPPGFRAGGRRQWRGAVHLCGQFVAAVHRLFRGKPHRVRLDLRAERRRADRCQPDQPLAAEALRSGTHHGAGSVGATAAGVALVVLGATGWGGVYAMMAAIFLALGSYGFVSSNAMALALGVDRARAGATSAVMGASSFAVGAAASGIAAALGDGTPLPIVAVIAAGFFGSTLALFTLARGRAAP
jgi:DHA1 family bicyclomycin/chloramphenicol resistance-like MFS transporter